MALSDESGAEVQPVNSPPEATQELPTVQLLLPEENAWHPTLDNTLQIKSGSASRSVSGISSAVEDGGDSQQLYDIAEKRLNGKGPNDFDYAGTHFSKENDIERPDSIPDDFDDDPPEPLETLIRGYMLTAANSTQSQFLPLSELEAIITSPNIKRELKRSGLTSDLNKIADEVWSTKEISNGTKTTRRKIFAILCLIDKAKEIQYFIEEGIFDSHLPFHFEHNQDQVRCNGKSPKTIQLFTRWQVTHRDSFANYQGRFLAPYLKFMTEDLRHYSLHHCVVLPFLEKWQDDVLNDAVATWFSIVYRVEIHSAHHDYLSPLGKSEKLSFAIKQLQQIEAIEHSRRKAYNREVAAYKRLNSIKHRHIVRLLATYEHHDRLHMIFPWADGNLFQFWKDRFPNLSDLPRNQVLAKWMIHQFLGLADGLNRIHESDTSLAPGDLKPEDKKRTHGRHGDIKPENILWFKNPTGGSSIDKLGDLMISDLGSTEFHGTRSQEVQANAAGGFTPTYKSPEFDIMERVRPESDIWSFGCVLFQFVVWYVLGWQGVQEFSDRRKEDSTLPVPLDNFFHFNKNEGSIEAKQSIRNEFTMLREHPSTSDFIVDLVDLIEFDLLRLRVGQRASSADIVTRLKTIELSCGSDQQYCTRKTTRDISRTPIDLCDKVHISFSKEMEAKYTKDVGPSLRPVPSDNTMQNSAEDDRSRTEEGDSEGAQQAENPGDRAKTNEASGTAGSNAQADQPGEHHRQQQQRLNTSNKVTLWIKKLFCFRS
ncbi:hypothetical protein GT037_010222 [Alternaria burnsii]|uniref:Protein kinase domain-containing protein n=1 Tax=Alternaria burnsii TaxID=1187904 RepID=A0A8H7E9P1_9PLEO|nr:uncharacterized protein GT037_010222 [Alternaria burnsii]KAF7671700.1 hypothetical protein GT037_010222 [Alternaria burnsii]CAI9632475.1 unnamed protein product [Alternaria burnsii]